MTRKTNKTPYIVKTGDTVDSSHRYWKRAVNRYNELSSASFGRPASGQVTISQGARVIVAGW